jgi:hypothetical protein
VRDALLSAELQFEEIADPALAEWAERMRR